MYISRIHIQNFRNYNDFTMDFHKGLNVIIGSNNSGRGISDWGLVIDAM